MGDEAVLETELADALTYFEQSENGLDTYSNAKALYGFIKAGEHLLVHQSLDLLHERKITRSMTERNYPDILVKDLSDIESVFELHGNPEKVREYQDAHSYIYFGTALDSLKIIFMNYHSLIATGMSPLDSYVVSALRARWIALGAWSVARKDTARPFVEHRIVVADRTANATFEQRVAAANNMNELLNLDVNMSKVIMAFAKDPIHGASFITRFAETIWCVEEFVVRTRGHHYKEDYKEVIKNYVEACHEKKVTFPDDLDYSCVFRVSIHPFGLNALPTVAHHFAMFGKLGSAGVIRFNSAPNGTAVITTTAACLRAMSSEVWFKNFELVYNIQLSSIFAFEKIIRTNVFNYHMSARLYGVVPATSFMVEKVEYPIENARSIASTMAALAQGFIEAMQVAKESKKISDFSFSRAKALAKHSASAPLGTLKIRSLVLYSIEAISGSKDISAATNAALPAPPKDTPADTKVK